MHYRFLPREAAMLARSWDRNSVCLSVCLSVTRMLCDETKGNAANLLIPHKRVITLVFRNQQSLVGDVSFHLKFASKVTHAPPIKKSISTNICL